MYALSAQVGTVCDVDTEQAIGQGIRLNLTALKQPMAEAPKKIDRAVLSLHAASVRHSSAVCTSG